MRHSGDIISLRLHLTCFRGDSFSLSDSQISLTTLLARAVCRFSLLHRQHDHHHHYYYQDRWVDAALFWVVRWLFVFSSKSFFTIWLFRETGGREEAMNFLQASRSSARCKIAIKLKLTAPRSQPKSSAELCDVMISCFFPISASLALLFGVFCGRLKCYELSFVHFGFLAAWHWCVPAPNRDDLSLFIFINLQQATRTSPWLKLYVMLI